MNRLLSLQAMTFGAALLLVASAAPAQEAGRAPTDTQRAARDALARVTQSTLVGAWSSLLDDPGYRYQPFEGMALPLDDEPNSASAQLARSACASDAVVVGRLSNPRPFLTEDAKYILTEYDLHVLQALRGALRPGDEVSYVRPGGKLLIDGRLAEVVDDAFPELETGEEYVMFLRRGRGTEEVFTVFLGKEARWIVDAIAIGDRATTASPWGVAELRAGLDIGHVQAAVAAATCE